MAEIVTYRPIEGFPGYRVGSDGSVWSCRRTLKWTRLRPQVTTPGGARVSMRLNGKLKSRCLAKLVCRAFHGPRPLGCCTFHFPDPDPLNNRADNLRWVPRGTLLAGRPFANGVWPQPRGEDHPVAKLTSKQVVAIREMIQSGFSCSEVAERFGVSSGHVHGIAQGKFRRSDDGPIKHEKRYAVGELHPGAKLDEAKVREIKQMILQGQSRQQIAKIFGVSQANIGAIARGKTWRHVPDSLAP